MKRALITGVTGQDGAYLAEFLLNKGYEVHGVKRRTSLFNTDRIDHLYQDPHVSDRRFILHHGDLPDSSGLIRIIQQVQPDEIYNLAAQSHVADSYEEPEYTAHYVFLMRFEYSCLKNILAFIKPRLQSFMVWYKKFRKRKLPRSIPVVLMRSPSFMRIGLPSITGRLMAYTHAMAFFLTMNPQCEVKPLLPGKLPGLLPE